MPQHVLSAFELSKLDISESEIQALCAVLDNPTPHLGAINRKKRYRKHSFNGSFFSEDRKVSAQISAGNKAYLAEINRLSNTQKPTFTGLSLFSGCGGLSLGFRAGGCRLQGFVEIDDGLAQIYQLTQSGPAIFQDLLGLLHLSIGKRADACELSALVRFSVEKIVCNS